MTATISRIAIAGSGAVAWLAASSLVRAFAARKLEVTVVDTGPAPDVPLGRWLLPSQRVTHALIGLPEVPFMRITGATFKFATEFEGWQGSGSRFLHAHGDIGAEIGELAFYKVLIRDALAGRVESPESYSVAATAARLGRFARPMGENDSLTASFTYAYHVEEAPYVELLREHASRLGVRRTAALADVQLDAQGCIETLLLVDGQRVSADLFLDCSGPEAKLLSRVGAVERDSWAAWLPVDRVVSALAPPVVNPPPLTRLRARDTGWTFDAPFTRSRLTGFAYSSAHLADDAALAEASSVPGAHAPRLVRLSPGRRRKFWHRNCLALGSSAAELEPLAGADLHLAQLGIGALIELLPLDRAGAIEGAEFNRVMAEYADALRDFTIAHYRVGAARPGAFWEAARAAAAPDSLAHKLDLFRASGRINLDDHESFEETDWAWLLLGSRTIPDALELQIESRLEQVGTAQLAPLRQHVERLAASMPPHIEYVQRLGSHAR